MVRRTGADAITAGAGAPARRARPGPVAASPAELPATRWEHRLLAAFFVTLVIPGSVSVAGLSLSPSRLFLLLAFVPLFLHWFRGRAWRITAGDVGILLYCFWIWVALFAVHGPARWIPPASSSSRCSAATWSGGRWCAAPRTTGPSSATSSGRWRSSSPSPSPSS